MDTYKLNYLNATVGMFGDFSNFKDVIDYVFENTTYKKALDIFGCDDIQDLSESVTNDQGIFDDEKARQLCMDCLDGEDLDDEDPEAEWGDEMYCRQAGKQAVSMKDALDAFSKLIDLLPELRQAAIYDARDQKTTRKAINYVQHFKFKFEKSYSATPEEQIMSSFNTLCDEVIKVLWDKALDEEIKHHD